MMNITTKLKYNTTASLVNRAVLLLSGLILPRLILSYYGAETHGLTSSINQFLSIITFLDLGVGAVVQSSLYRPLAKKDNAIISEVLTSAKGYFRNISYVLILYVVILTFFYPLIIDQSLSFLPTAFLIIAISISTFSQYYFGLINELLLNADQRAYIQLTAETLTIFFSLIATVLLIISGFSIQIVKLSTSLIYLIRPIFLKYYVDKHYDVYDNVELKGEPIKNKWNGMAQHIAYTITTSTDIVVLTLFSTLENVSIYAIYNMVVNGIQLLISSLTNNFKAFFGNLLANDENKLLMSYFTKIEWLVHTLVTYLYGMTAILIVPFVAIYTSGVENVNYRAPIFSLILVLGIALNSIRTPYQAMILGAGHYKETQLSSIVEAIINIVVSLALVRPFGLVGVSVGTLIAMGYRTLYLVHYLSQNILYRSINIFIKQFLVDVLAFTLMIYIGSMIKITPSSLIEWIWMAILFGVIFFIMLLLINIFFYKEQTIFYIKKALKR